MSKLLPGSGFKWRDPKKFPNNIQINTAAIVQKVVF